MIGLSALATNILQSISNSKVSGYRREDFIGLEQKILEIALHQTEMPLNYDQEYAALKLADAFS